MKPTDLAPVDSFPRRHLGPRPSDVAAMLETIGVSSLDTLIGETVPKAIRLVRALDLPPALSESEALARLATTAAKNKLFRSYIGLGYVGTLTPTVILRNILENPGWYTQYTPYQAEISQGRLEALLNYQTMVADLTALPLSNASLLDEATAAAEAMFMCYGHAAGKRKTFFVADDNHPQVIEVVKTRAKPLGIEIVVGPAKDAVAVGEALCGALVAYPTSFGEVVDWSEFCAAVHAVGGLVVMAADLLALTLVKAPGELGADIAVGSAQRFGVPVGFGGPHAAYLSTRDELKRIIPGRIIGVSKDAAGKPAMRLSLQTREQHIRRDRATSNICTAQVLLAIMASMYAVYHGPDGLRRIARRVHGLTSLLAHGLKKQGVRIRTATWFDTLRIDLSTGERDAVLARAASAEINLRVYPDGVGVTLDETVSLADVGDLLAVIGGATVDVDGLVGEVAEPSMPKSLVRESAYLTHPSFHRYHAEHEMLRYLNRLQAKDLSLTTSMIPLGSCTMKLNATSEMLPVTWPGFSSVHPFAPAEQAAGYRELTDELSKWLAEITGFAAVSLQPNSGAQGEYAGLLAIRGYHESRGDSARDVCLIPTSAHGTNPASAVLAGYRVVAVACDQHGNIDVEDLRAKAEAHKSALAALMITYPSTHGVFEPGVRDICKIVHDAGGQVYLDGANMNAQVGLCRPGDFGADVCHLNLHKTFCIPHGGGGPGMGPIGVAPQLVPFLPSHPLTADGAAGPVSAAPFGSASILTISYMYIAMMGAEGLTDATRFAILNANYMAARLADHYPILYRGVTGRVAHEFIIDCRQFKKTAGIEVDDLAKRLMDYGFHAPTMSFPVPGTLMIEPTESESKEELDRLCEALIGIRREILDVEEGRADRLANPLKHAPHTAEALLAAEWNRPYSRETAAYPAPWTRIHKYWPPVARVDNAYGDRNLICTCPSMDEFTQ